MNKTISVMLFKREEYSRQVLEHISRAQGIEEWSVYVYCDNPGHDKIFNMSQQFPFVKRAHLAPTRRGMKLANPWAIGTNFKLYKSDLNLHVEDDVLIGPDALRFVEACSPYVKDTIGSVSLAGYMEKIEKPADKDLTKVFRNHWFTCGYGWATTKKVYEDHFSKMEDVGDIRSWAMNFNGHFLKHGLDELRSYTRRSKNIGAEGSTNPIYGPGVLNCEDMGDEWTGATGPVLEWDFSEV